MEQATQQISQKPPLPIKTKIAAWWIVIIGVFWLIVCMIIRLPEIIIFVLPFSLILFFIPGILILKRVKWAWLFYVLTQPVLIFLTVYPRAPVSLISKILNIFIGMMTSLFFSLFSLHGNSGSTILSLIFLLPLILLLLDRKNFFRIAS